MTSNAIILRCIAAFDELSVPYMLVGSYSSNLYGRPRSTQDADFVAQLPGGVTSALFKRLGPEFRIDPQMSFETVTGTRRGYRR